MLVLGSSLTGIGPAQAGPLPGATLPLWSAAGAAGTIVNELALSRDGNRLYATGGLRNDPRAWVTSYATATGAAPWTFRSQYESTTNSVVVSPDNNTIVIGGWVAPSGGERNGQMSLWALDRNGANLWSARYTGNGANRGDFVADLVFAPDGTTVYATGVVWNANRRRDLVVAAYNAANGRLRWRRVVDSGQTSDGEGISEEGRAIAVTPNGASVVVTGYNARPAALSNEQSKALTLVLNASNGATRWSSRSFLAETIRTPWGVDVAVSGSSIYVAGASWYYPGEDSFATRHRLSDGNRTWAVRHVAGEEVSASAEAVAANAGGAYLAGPTSSSSFYVWAQRASDGATRWSLPAGLPGVAHDIALGVGGARVYVAGRQSSNFTVVGIDTADGSVDWMGSRSPTTTTLEEASDVAVDPDGEHVYAAGHGGPDGDGLVVAWDL